MSLCYTIMIHYVSFTTDASSPIWGPNGGWAIKIGNPMFSFSCQPVLRNGVKEMHRQAISQIYPWFISIDAIIKY